MVVGPTQTSDYQTQSYEQSSLSEVSPSSPSVLDFATSQLERAFGENAQFKRGQKEVILALVEHRRNTLLVQPAGGGKTFVYMTAAKALRERTGRVALIISPLLALIRNQIDLAEQYGVLVQHISSSLRCDKGEWSKTMSMIRTGQLDALITTPEQLATGIFDEFLSSIGMIVVDEAHCICQWGFSFRPDYCNLEPFIQQLEDDRDAARPILAVSSTVTEHQERHLCDIFKIREDPVRGSLPLNNLHLEVIRLPDEQTAFSWLAEIVPQLQCRGIIYCLTVAKVEMIAFWLRSKGVASRAYHGNVIPDAFDLEEEKVQFQEDSERYRKYLEQQFMANAIDVLVSTSALGMGVDISDVRYVIVFEPPTSLQILYQEFGRCGRNTDSNTHGTVVCVGNHLPPHTWHDVFFAKEDVSEVYATIEKSSSGMNVDKLEMECNLPVETIRNVLTYLSTMKQPIVVCRPVEGVWQKTEMNEKSVAEMFCYIDEMKKLVDIEHQAGLDKVTKFLTNNKECMMKLLCMDLGGEKIEEDYCCSNCTVCKNENLDVNVNLFRCSDEDLTVLQKSGVRRLVIQKLGVPRDAFQKYTFEAAFLEAPKVAPGISVSNCGAGGLATELSKFICKKTPDNRYNTRGVRKRHCAKPENPQTMRDGLIQHVVELFRWSKVSESFASSGVWVTYIPSHDIPIETLDNFVQRFANELGYPFKKTVELNGEKLMDNRWNQKNAYARCRNLDGTYRIKEEAVLPGPVVLIDFLVRSGWTILVVAELLKQAGSGPAIPLALMATARNNKYMSKAEETFFSCMDKPVYVLSKL